MAICWERASCSLGFLLLLLYFIPSKMRVFLSHLVSRTGCEIRLCRFLSIAFSTILIDLLLMCISCCQMRFKTSIFFDFAIALSKYLALILRGNRVFSMIMRVVLYLKLFMRKDSFFITDHLVIISLRWGLISRTVYSFLLLPFAFLFIKLISEKECKRQEPVQGSTGIS